MTTVKLSHSILSAWSSGNFEQAIGQYLGNQLPATPAMELGKIKHELWAGYIQSKGNLPEELGADQLVEPIVEQKYQKFIPFSDDIQILIRGVIDLEDEDIITDFKCGMGEPKSYIDKLQLDYYKLLRPNAKMGRYICFNPYTNVVRRGIKFLHTTDAENALNHILTYGGEMIDYLQANKLLKDFK